MFYPPQPSRGVQLPKEGGSRIRAFVVEFSVQGQKVIAQEEHATRNHRRALRNS